MLRWIRDHLDPVTEAADAVAVEELSTAPKHRRIRHKPSKRHRKARAAAVYSGSLARINTIGRFAPSGHSTLAPPKRIVGTTEAR